MRVALYLALATLAAAALAQEKAEDHFDVVDVGPPGADVPGIEPWKVTELDPDYGGQWVVAGDLDGDGDAELVSAENVNENDTHYTSAVSAQELDGSVLWRWGDAEAGRKTWHHDVACQVHDWNGDGRLEVAVATEGFLVELDGATGDERRRIAIPPGATDCLVFCDLAGRGRRGEVLIKDRYHRIWALDYEGDVLWSVTDPGGFRTAHQPRPMDIDGDGRDEIMAGYALLNPGGSVRWVYESEAVDLSRGHLDCARLVRSGPRPEDCRIAVTCCGANNVAMLDGEGKVLWEAHGRHFESIDVGRLAKGKGRHLVVDIDHQPYGDSPMWIVDESGRRLGSITTPYSRDHGVVDWDGDGVDEIVNAHNGALYSHRGERLATFLRPGMKDAPEFEPSLFIGDMTGDHVPDVVLTTPQRVYTYRNEHGAPGDSAAPLGSPPNLTLY